MKIVVLNNEQSDTPITAEQVIERLQGFQVECSEYDRSCTVAKQLGGELHFTGDALVFNFTGAPNSELDFAKILS